MEDAIAVLEQDSRFRNLRTWNLSMFFLHLAQGILMLVLSSSFALPVTTAYVEFNVATQKLNTVISSLGDIRIGPLVAAFLFLSALAHLLVSIGGGYRWYVRNLKKGMNVARWIEYSLSSSLMIVVIALLVGVYDLSMLILLFFLNAMMILFGWIMEVHNQTTQKTDWTLFIFGCIAGASTMDCRRLIPVQHGTGGIQGADVRVLDLLLDIPVLQRLRDQYDPAVQEGWKVARLSFC